jgi:hypothetical protein
MGIIETLLATGVTGVVNALFCGQALTISGPTGPELAYLSMLFAMCQTLGYEFLPAKFWAGLWQSFMTIAYTLLEWCALINRVTRFTEEIFSIMVATIEVVVAATRIVGIFTNPTMSIGGKLYSVIIVGLTYAIAVKFRELRTSDWLNATWRKQLANYGVSITIISLTIISSLVSPAFGITDINYLNVPEVIEPTWTDPTTGMRRAWLIKPMGYTRPFPVGGIFLMMVPAIGGTLLGYLDQNLTEVLVNRKDRMFKKLPAYHLSNILLGVILYPFCAILGLPCCHPATVRSLAHVMSVTSTELVPLPDGKTNTIRITNVAEQRLTHLMIHILVLVALTAGAALSYVRRHARSAPRLRLLRLLARPARAPARSRAHAPPPRARRLAPNRCPSRSSSASSSTSASPPSAATRWSTAPASSSRASATGGRATTTCRTSTAAR